MDEIEDCVLCFQTLLPQAPFIQGGNITKQEIDTCVNKYIYSALSNELPTFERISAERGKVTLPSVVPANNWWSVTVKLPCKPPIFQFWNAYCINSFANDPRSQDFLLTQNKLIVNKDIVFLATFSDTCRFDVEDIKIIWSESTPGLALPQVSQFAPTLPPKSQEPGHLYFNTKALARLRIADGGIPAELRMANNRNPRKKREVDANLLNSLAASYNRLGVIMPCTVQSFQVTDQLGIPVPSAFNKKRHLLNTKSLWQRTNSVLTNTRYLNLLNFTLDFGYEKTGCFFGASEIQLVVNPPEDWINGEKRLSCFFCEGASSEEDCRRRGKEIYCNQGEICQSETRQISKYKVQVYMQP